MKMFSDILGVIQNASMPAVTLAKMRMAIAFHCVQECVAAKIISLYYIEGKDNFADIFTKPVDGLNFKYHAGDILWKMLMLMCEVNVEWVMHFDTR